MIKLKPFEQSSGFCGPASLKMVFDYYGLVISEADFAKAAGSDREKGTTFEGMIRAAKHFGFHTFYKENSTLDDIRYFIKRDVPVIVAWFSPFDGSYEGHFSVVIDITGKDTVLVDPIFPIRPGQGGSLVGKPITYFRRTRKLKFPDFVKLWFDFEGDYIKRQKDLLLRRMLVATPFKEKFPVKAKKLKLTPGETIPRSSKKEIKKTETEKKITAEIKKVENNSTDIKR